MKLHIELTTQYDNTIGCFMIQFPNISPEIFSITFQGFEFSLRWYAVSYIAGFIAAIYVMRFFLKRDYLWRYRTAPMEVEQIDSFITYLILGVIIGGRVGYVLFYNLPFFLDNPVSIVRIWEGGMSFHGGFLGVVIAVYCFCKFNGIPVLSGSDLVAIASPPGLMFGRIANFINAELWGKPTDFAFGVVFPGVRAQDCPDIVGPCARHATQLYEAGLEGLILFGALVVLAFLGFFKKPGFIMGVFFFGYGICRFFVEIVREADPQFVTLENPAGYVVWFGNIGLSMGQVLSIPMIILGFLILLLAFTKRGRVNV